MRQAGSSSNQILQDIDDLFVAKGRKKEKSMGPSSSESPQGSSENAPHSAQDNPIHEAGNVQDIADDRPLGDSPIHEPENDKENANDRPLTVVPEESMGPLRSESPHGSSQNAPQSAEDNPTHEAESVKDDTNDTPLADNPIHEAESVKDDTNDTPLADNPIHEAESVKGNANNDTPLTVVPEDSSGNQVNDEEKKQHSDSSAASPAVLNQTISTIASQKASDAREAGASAYSPAEATEIMERQDESLSSSPANHVKSVTARFLVQEDAEEPVTLLLNYVGDDFQQQDSETEQPTQVHDDERRQRCNSAPPSSAANLQTEHSAAVENPASAMQQSGAAASNSRQPDHSSSEAAHNGVQDVENWRGKNGIERRDGGAASDVPNTKSQAIISQSEANKPPRNKFADMLADKDVSGNYDVRWK